MTWRNILAQVNPENVRTWIERTGTFAYHWKIDRYQEVMYPNDNYSVYNKRFEILADKMDDTPNSKWEVSLDFGSKEEQSKLKHERRVYVNCKLVEIIGETKRTDCEIMSSLNVVLLNKHSDGQEIVYTIGERQYRRVNESHRVFLISYTDFKAHESVVNNRGGMTLRIDLNIYKPSYVIDPQPQQISKDSASMAETNMACLLSTKSTKFDAKFISSDNKEFPCHSAVLIATSPYFKTMYESGFSEAQTGIIKVLDFSGKTLEVLVHYIYTGRLQEIWKDEDVIVELMSAAHRYEITVLLEYIDNMLGDIVEKYSRTTRLALKNLTEKLNLKTDINESLAKLVLSAENTTEIVSLFEESNKFELN